MEQRHMRGLSLLVIAALIITGCGGHRQNEQVRQEHHLYG
jgi:uncharacterized protein YcfL